METLGKRVARVREERKMSQTALADAIHRINRALKPRQSTIHSLETGDVERPRLLRELAMVLEVSEDWLLTGKGDRSRKPPVDAFDIPVFGYAGARERVELIKEDDTRSLGGIRPPSMQEGFVAVVVKGNSMFPAYRDGDHLFFQEYSGNEPSAFLGRDCVVITDKSRCYVKRVIAGRVPGTYDLMSYDPAVDPIRDVGLESAWPIQWVRRA